MSWQFVVSVEVEGRPVVFYARCHPEQLAATVAIAAEALLSEVEWMAATRAGLTFKVSLA